MVSGLTLTQICEETGAPFYVVKYLNMLGRLPVVRGSNGRGYCTLYDRGAIQVVQSHLEKPGKAPDGHAARSTVKGMASSNA